MNSIFKRINADTTMVDFDKFIAPVLKGGLLTKPEKLDSLEFNMVRDMASSQVAYHAVVRIDANFIDQRMVRKLRRQPRGKVNKPIEFHFIQRDNDENNNLHQRPTPKNLNNWCSTDSSENP